MSTADSLVNQATFRDDDLPLAEEVGDDLRPAQLVTPAAVPPRLTVVDRLSYLRAGADPEDAAGAGEICAFDRKLVSGEQLYRRDTTVGPDMAPLDTGWVGNDCAHVVIVNLSKKGSGKDVRVHFGTGKPADTVLGIVVAPGESCRFTPFAASRIWLSCAPDQEFGTKVRLVVVPN